MSDNPTKPLNLPFPAATPEVAQMFGHSSDDAKQDASAAVAASAARDNQSIGGLGVLNLPVDPHAKAPVPTAVLPVPGDSAHAAESAPEADVFAGIHSGDTHILPPPPKQPDSITSNLFAVLKLVTPYVAVFSIAVLAYFYFFTGNFNFSKPTNSQPKVSTSKESTLASLEQQNSADYYNWISQFYYDVSNPKVIDPETDNSGNGLSNFQKYMLNLNPKSYDTLGLGMPDSQAINDGINPLTGNPLTDDQKTIIAKYFDMEVVMNRLALANMQKNGQVAGVNTQTGSQQNVIRSGYVGFPTGQPAQSQPAAQPSQQPASYTAPKTGADLQIQSNSAQLAPSDLSADSNIDTNIPGRLDIPSLKISAPLAWSTSPNNFDKDLQNGVIHYPGTAMPGQIGTAYISGHSSNYVWAKGNFNHVFTHLNDLADDTSFSITVTDKGGKVTVYHYVVTGRQQYLPTDQAQFVNGGKSVVALSTCWPVGSTAKRLVVYGELTQVEN